MEIGLMGTNILLICLQLQFLFNFNLMIWRTYGKQQDLFVQSS